MLCCVPDSSERIAPRGDKFVTTHWTAVIRAGQPDGPGAEEALSELCRIYWLPLYAFIRGQGQTPAAAEDLTQGFFAKLLEKNYVAGANQAKGRFRSFLLTALKRYLANEWDRNHAAKRGGFHAMVEIDKALAEPRVAPQLVHGAQPDMLFERQWAVTLLDAVMRRLQQEYVETGRTKLFQHLARTLTQEDDAQPYAAIAQELELTEAAVKTASRRLRLRYQELLREEIARTVSSPQEVEDEFRYLFALFEQ
jgi:RNA polymerase sigma-70 factor (ECF subfamily)